MTYRKASYDALILAMFEQFSEDYVESKTFLKKMRGEPRTEKAKEKREICRKRIWECEYFIKSDWAATLWSSMVDGEIDPQKILNALDQRVLDNLDAPGYRGRTQRINPKVLYRDASRWTSE